MAKATKPKQQKKDDTVIAQDNYMRFQDAERGGHADFIKRAQRNDEFYAGVQWDEADKKALDEQSRPALTLNLILSTVNAIIGEQLDRKVEPVFRAIEQGYENTAHALNKITRAILNDCDYDSIEEQMFADGLITGRGYIDIRLGFEKNALGDVDMCQENPIEVVLDKEAKSMDPRTWNEVFIARWMTIEDIEIEYGEAKADAVFLLAETSSYSDVGNFDFFGETFGGEQSMTEDDAERRALRRVRVIERQHYKLTKQMCYVDLRTGAIRPVPLTTKPEEAEANAQEYGAQLVERKIRRVRITTSIDRVLLHDDWSMYRSFTIVPFFPYFRRGRPFGVVDNLIDPQNLLNKTSSQELHIVNTTANSGWVVEEGSLANMDDDELETRGAETGLVITYKRNQQPPQKIQPNQIPTGIDRISQKAASTIREISSVNSSMLGTSREDQSGRAQEASVARGQVQVSVVLSNLRRARVAVLRKVLEIVQDFYTEERYFTIAGDTVVNDPESQVMTINQYQDDGSILNDVTAGNYAIEIDYRPAAGSLYDKEFEEAIRMREMGIAIPDYVVVQYSNLTKRGEIAALLKQSQGFGEPSEEEAALQQMQIEHQVRMLQKEIEKIDADIGVAIATAKEKMANVTTLEGYNQAQMEVARLQQEREIKDKELSLRIALAARSHSNQSNQNDKRIASQVAMKSMDLSMAERRSAEKPTPKHN